MRSCCDTNRIICSTAHGPRSKIKHLRTNGTVYLSLPLAILGQANQALIQRRARKPYFQPERWCMKMDNDGWFVARLRSVSNSSRLRFGVSRVSPYPPHLPRLSAVLCCDKLPTTNKSRKFTIGSNQLPNHCMIALNYGMNRIMASSSEKILVILVSFFDSSWRRISCLMNGSIASGVMPDYRW